MFPQFSHTADLLPPNEPVPTIAFMSPGGQMLNYSLCYSCPTVTLCHVGTHLCVYIDFDYSDSCVYEMTSLDTCGLNVFSLNE